ncbi:hypothetical protein PINS_up004365 [Pythium insidiosum]|nr:hypothetical protein PINS_up004365 [Pythium insidiosum]
MEVAAPSSIITPPLSRWSRFLEEDAGALAFSTTLVSGVLLGRSYLQERSRVPASALFHAQRALRKTLPKVPAVFASSAVGIIGMKMTVAAVQDWRRDYTRASIKIALPLFVALLHAPRGTARHGEERDRLRRVHPRSRLRVQPVASHVFRIRNGRR